MCVNFLRFLFNSIQKLFNFWLPPIIRQSFHIGYNLESYSALLHDRLYYCPVENPPDCIENYQYHSLICENNWSSLYCIKNISNNEAFTLRKYSKEMVSLYNLSSMVAQEAHLMLSLDYFLFPMGYSYFQNEFDYYIVFDYTPGIRLDMILENYRNGKGLPETLVKFISAQVLLAIEYLQKANVLVREIHPEDIILMEDGYIKIIGINHACLPDIDSFKSKEVRGRPYFISQEYLRRGFWTIESDWWCFGVFLYYLISGKTPFDSKRGMLSIFAKINSYKRKNILRYSYFFHDLVDNLLNPNTHFRYTCADIFQHRWYSSINFKLLCFKSLTAPSVHNKVYSSVKKCIGKVLPTIKNKETAIDIEVDNINV